MPGSCCSSVPPLIIEVENLAVEWQALKDKRFEKEVELKLLHVSSVYECEQIIKQLQKKLEGLEKTLTEISRQEELQQFEDWVDDDDSDEDHLRQTSFSIEFKKNQDRRKNKLEATIKSDSASPPSVKTEGNSPAHSKVDVDSKKAGISADEKDPDKELKEMQNMDNNVEEDKRMIIKAAAANSSGTEGIGVHRPIGGPPLKPGQIKLLREQNTSSTFGDSSEVDELNREKLSQTIEQGSRDLLVDRSRTIRPDAISEVVATQQYDDDMPSPINENRVMHSSEQAIPKVGIDDQLKEVRVVKDKKKRIVNATVNRHATLKERYSRANVENFDFVSELDTRIPTPIALIKMKISRLKMHEREWEEVQRRIRQKVLAEIAAARETLKKKPTRGSKLRFLTKGLPNFVVYLGANSERRLSDLGNRRASGISRQVVSASSVRKSNPEFSDMIGDTAFHGPRTASSNSGSNLGSMENLPEAASNGDLSDHSPKAVTPTNGDKDMEHANGEKNRVAYYAETQDGRAVRRRPSHVIRYYVWELSDREEQIKRCCEGLVALENEIEEYTEELRKQVRNVSRKDIEERREKLRLINRRELKRQRVILLKNLEKTGQGNQMVISPTQAEILEPENRELFPVLRTILLAIRNWEMLARLKDEDELQDKVEDDRIFDEGIIRIEETESKKKSWKPHILTTHKQRQFMA